MYNIYVNFNLYIITRREISIMVHKLETRRFYLSPGITCIVEIPIPDLATDSSQAEELGSSYYEKTEKLDQFLTEMFFPQYIHAAKRAINCFTCSQLPPIFLEGQKLIITPIPVHLTHSPAMYHSGKDTIIIDSDSFSIGFCDGSGIFLYGHEVGHRIIEFRKRAKASAIDEVKGILSISDSSLAEETLCDAFGYHLDSSGKTRFDVINTPESKRKALVNVALKLAWSC